MVTVLDLFDNHKTTTLSAEQRSKYSGLLQVRTDRGSFLISPDFFVTTAKSLLTPH
jgi:hypothetical protein